ncbi:MAG: N-acetyl sugar amidotransferase, partial [uncultured bacterium]
ESPSIEECRKIGLKGIHLGDYIFWDDERQTEFVRDTYDWRETEIEGTYKKYKSAECIMPGVHDFTNYLKRGYSRASFHASVDVRSGLLTREEAFQLASKYDPVRPEVLDYYLKITGLSEEEFYKIIGKHKMPQLKNVKLPVKRKKWKNTEKLLPYAQQVINKYKPVKTRHARKATRRSK